MSTSFLVFEQKLLLMKGISKIVQADRRFAMVSSLFLSNIGYMPVLIKAMSGIGMDKDSHYECSPYSTKSSKPWLDEREELLARARWLIKEVVVDPEILIRKMPSVIGRQYQGQWAIYACSMTLRALCNLNKLFPDVCDHFKESMGKLVEMILSPVIRYYDTMEWKEDALKTLGGKKSHMTYLSILAWSIINYTEATDNHRYHNLLTEICNTLCRRMTEAEDMNLPSFPNRIVFLPDMMFSIMALKDYDGIYGFKYGETVDKWLNIQLNRHIDKNTGLFISKYSPKRRKQRISGTYSALNTTCLCLICPSLGRSQYNLLKYNFAKWGKYVAVKEYSGYNPKLAFDINAGPIIHGISPTGTSFALGAVTYLGDWKFREGLLRTCELGGKTIRKGDTLHYKLAEIMLTGEAITLAMRTNFNFKEIL